jgi:molybdopterin converting factor small subunit
MAETDAEITVKILYFAHFGDLAGRSVDALRLPAGATIGSLASLLGQRDRRLADLIGYGRASINAEWATADSVLSDGDEVAFMPPMSGG